MNKAVQDQAAAPNPTARANNDAQRVQGKAVDAQLMPSQTRVGKIARLPAGIREKINQMIHEGKKAATILDWLNALPEVKAVLKSDYNDEPISPTNFTRWREGGYKEWARKKAALARAEAEDLPDPDEDPQYVASLALRLSAKLTELLQIEAECLSEMPASPERTRATAALLVSYYMLRRGDFFGHRIQAEMDDRNASMMEAMEKKILGDKVMAETYLDWRDTFGPQYRAGRSKLHHETEPAKPEKTEPEPERPQTTPKPKRAVKPQQPETEQMPEVQKPVMLDGKEVTIDGRPFYGSPMLSDAVNQSNARAMLKRRAEQLLNPG